MSIEQRRNGEVRFLARLRHGYPRVGSFGGVAAFDDVAGDSAAAIVLGRFPGESRPVFGHVGDFEWTAGWQRRSCSKRRQTRMNVLFSSSDLPITLTLIGMLHEPESLATLIAYRPESSRPVSERRDGLERHETRENPTNRESSRRCSRRILARERDRCSTRVHRPS